MGGGIAGGGSAGWRQYRRGALLAGLMVMWSPSLLAGQWRVDSFINASETYTDNVALAPVGSEETDFVTQLTPGITVHGAGTRSKLDLDYRLQNLIYASDGDRNSTHSQLTAGGELELVKDIFSVDASGSISQQIVDASGRIGVDNLNLGNRADVAAYGLGPHLRLNWKAFIKSDFRSRFERVENQSRQIRDAELRQHSAHVGSGPYFTRISWNVDFRREDLNRIKGVDSRRNGTRGDFRYRLSSTWNFLALGGYEDNALRTPFAERNGSYWSAGLEWRPSRKLTASAAAGDKNEQARLTLRPSERSSLSVGYRNRDVGLITGPSWDVKMVHQTRRTTWQLGYSEDSTATQTLQLTGQQFFTLVDSAGNPILDSMGQPVILAQNLFSLGDDEFIRKRGQLSVTLNTGKSDMVFSAFNEDRTYAASNDSEGALGANASWSWKFALNRQSVFGAGWQRRNPASTDQHDDLWHTNIGLAQTVARGATASLTYGHITRNSYISRFNYDENRLTLLLHKRF